MFMINLQLYLYKLSMINYKSDINDNNFEKWIFKFWFLYKSDLRISTAIQKY